MIVLHHVSKSFGPRPALSDVSLTFQGGERVALVGPNGSGKTTLMRCMLGLLAFEGRITMAGHDVMTDHAAAQVHVAYVPQRAPALVVPVREFALFWASTRKLPMSRLGDAADRFGLDIDTIGSKAFNALSGGMQQKLLAASALASDCAILLLDEPTANLDPKARVAFFDALAARTPRPTVVLSSHRIEELGRLVDRVVVLTEGTVSSDNPLDVFLADPERAQAAGVDTSNLVPFRRAP